MKFNWLSQRSLHNAPIFRLLLKVAVKGTHQCDFQNFWGVLDPNQISKSFMACTFDTKPKAKSKRIYFQSLWEFLCRKQYVREALVQKVQLRAKKIFRDCVISNCKLTWLVLGGDPAARSGKLGLFRELNPGPPAPEAGIIPLDQTAKCVTHTHAFARMPLVWCCCCCWRLSWSLFGSGPALPP